MFCFSHLPYIYLIGHLVFSIWLLFWSFLALCLNLLKKKNTKSISDNRFECIEDDNDSAQVIILSSQSAVWLDWAQFWFWVWGQCTPVSFLTADYSERHCPVAAAVLHTPCRCQNLPAIPSTHSSSSRPTDSASLLHISNRCLFALGSKLLERHICLIIRDHLASYIVYSLIINGDLDDW